MLGSLSYSYYRPPRLPVDREYLGSGEEYSHEINYSRQLNEKAIYRGLNLAKRCRGIAASFI